MAVNAVSVYAQQLDPGLAELCRYPWTCAIAEGVAELWLWADAGALALAGFVLLAHLQLARPVVAKEQSRTAAERRAFEDFARRVGEMRPAQQAPQQPVGGGTTLAAAARPGTRSLEAVADAYRDTVMSVDHYDEEYGEPLAENIALAFGDDVAGAVLGGQDLSPVLQQLLVSKATQAATERSNLMSTLEVETEALAEAERTLESVEAALDDYGRAALARAPYGALLDRWEQLDDLEARCRNAIERRQEQIHAEPMYDLDRDPGPSLFDYLYGSLPVSYPVLADASAVLERLDDCRSLLVKEVCYRY